jgi:hypothetical protein
MTIHPIYFYIFRYLALSSSLMLLGSQTAGAQVTGINSIDGAPLNIGAGNAVYMTILPASSPGAGNVGIGTTTPAESLQIQNAFLFRQVPWVTGDQLQIFDPVNSSNYLLLGNLVSGSVIASGIVKNGGMGVSGAVANGGGNAGGNLLLDPVAGNVGIGTTNPQVTLDVNGGIRTGSQAVVTACGSGITNGEGTQRYNYATHQMEICNGTAWGPFVPPSPGNVLGGGVCHPNQDEPNNCPNNFTVWGVGANTASGPECTAGTLHWTGLGTCSVGGNGFPVGYIFDDGFICVQ